MPSNELVLLNNLLSDWNQQAPEGFTEDKLFDLFCLEQMLKDQDLYTEEIQSGHVGGADDGGIDGWLSILNGEVLDDDWDLMIAHPPCTYLCVPGAHYLHKWPHRWNQLGKAKGFFMRLFNANINKICIENPLPHRYAELPKYSQIIQPWQFGHEISKRTCLWLRGLPLLSHTKVMENHGDRYIRTERQQKLGYGKVSNSKWYAQASPKERSRTFQGIADAMADQWGNLI